MSAASDGLRVKICGVRRPEHAEAAVAAGAAYVGVVFFPPSPRSATLEEAAAVCAATAPGVATVGLFVDPSDEDIDAALGAAPLDMIQLHGDEPPERVAAVRARLGLPVMKAIGIGAVDDLARIERYEPVADQILCDAKPAPGAAVPGGAGEAFEWRLLSGRSWAKPWLLAGGLDAANVAEAARVAGARQVDVSSGVEAARGEKSADKIRAFCAAARTA